LPKTTEMDEDKFKPQIWDIWKEVHDGIGPVREEAFKLLPAFRKDEKAKDDVVAEDPELKHYYEYKPVPQEEDNPKKLSEFAQEATTCAREFQEATQKLMGKTPGEILRITTRGGCTPLLHRTDTAEV